MPILLDLVYMGLLIVCSPWLGWKIVRRGKARDGWAEKLLGRAPRRLDKRPCIWFHAVSVGEVLALRPVVREIARRRSDWEVVISTTTPTGLEVASQTFPDLITFYAPLDFSWAVREAIARVRPTVLALVELEIWPNWVMAARRSGARVVVVNGRLSPRSFRGYGRIRRLLAPVLRQLDLVAVQSSEYADRFRALGVDEDRVVVTGSVKYDGLEFARDNARTLALRRTLGLSPADVIFVAGSTMEGEEEAAFRTYQALRADCPQLRLILIPRHTDRADAIERYLHDQNQKVTRLSQVRQNLQAPLAVSRSTPPVYLIDTMGELGAVWGLADVAFVGGSLYPGRNGQNMMEPAAFGAAVLFGPHTGNFKEATEGLLHREGALRVANEAELTEAVRQAIEDPETAELMGSNGRRYVMDQQGATERTLSILDRVLAGSRPGPARPERSPRNPLATARIG